ncbi:hypothetical protein PHMEG_00014176 [Phytophthora megakarya]|uniref:Integrase catalytic domain-containing protein n=1 Tax=Phytophthora megakarya TaxID=4795 RepID=A0A225W5Z8_9STRA|nr:hypothetical protein PHMEG_00014176 [Phytophthora megakarya]
MGTCQYVLVLKDGLTHFCELVACDSPTNVVAATPIVDWWKRFGAHQGSHFKIELIAQVCKTLGIDQSLVVAYAPWINGTIERLNRDVLQVLRVLLMEYTLDTHEWVLLLPLRVMGGFAERGRLTEGLTSLPRDVLASVEQFVHASDDSELTSAHSVVVQAKRS